MSSLHNDLATWAGKARASGLDRIEITTETADELSDALMQRAALAEALREVVKVRVYGHDNIWAGRDRCVKIAKEALAALANDSEPAQPRKG